MGRKKIKSSERKNHRTFRMKDSEYNLLKRLGDGRAQKGFDLLIQSMLPLIEEMDKEAVYK